MHNHLVAQAVKDIWCSPSQDRQFNIQLNRLSPLRGYVDWFSDDWERIDLPNATSTFHVFNMGQYNPRALGLLPSYRQWTRADIIMRRNSMIFSVFTDQGIQFPRHRCYYQLSRNNDLMVAVEEVPWMAPAVRNRVYLRVYSNALLYSQRNVHGQLIMIQGQQVTTRNQIVDLQTETGKQPAAGRRFCFVNGVYVEQITLLNTKPGDDVEYYDDLSVKRTTQFNIAGLKQFTSTLDSLAKFILATSINDGTIDFHDDIEVFVCKRGLNNTFKGFYLHRNDLRTMRNLTHADYSLAVQSVMNLLQMNGITSNLDCFVELNIRESGLKRPLSNVESRIHDLYTLPYADRVNAMIGVRANVSVWQADALESSAYMRTMSYPSTQIPAKTVEDTYGHHMGGALLANTPQPIATITGAKGVKLPYLLAQRATIYEYDAQGKMINYYLHDAGENYLARNAAIQFVEGYKGYGAFESGDYFNVPVVDIPQGANFRCYRRITNTIDGVPGPWQDVTGSNRYLVSNGKIQWVTSSGADTLVRFNTDWLAYNQEINTYEGNYRFTLREKVLRDGFEITHAMDIPRGDLDVFIGNPGQTLYSLVEGIDYVVQFPEVMIINRKFLTSDRGPLMVSVRYRDFCDQEVKHKCRAETGWISHGRISANGKYDLRKDRVTRIVTKGGMQLKQNVVFAEDSAGTVGANPLNGTPYSIRDEVIPLNSLYEQDTYEMWNRSETIDAQIEAYLTEYRPLPQAQGPNVMTQSYLIYSPFINAIYSDLIRGILAPSWIFTHFTREKVDEVIQPYLPLLRFDPTQHGTWVDDRYATVAPHNRPGVQEIVIHFMRFLQFACDLYMKDKINLEPYFTVTAAVD